MHGYVSRLEVRSETIAIPELVKAPKSIETVPEVSPTMEPAPVYSPTPLSLYSSLSMAEEDLVQSSFQDAGDNSNGVRIVDRTELETLTPAFYVDGIAYYSFSDVLAQGGFGTRRVVFSDAASDDDSSSDDAVVIPYDADDSPDDDLPQRSGGGDPEVWNLSMTIDSQHADSGLSTINTPNAMIEGRVATVGAIDPLANADYVTITAPALPSVYVSTISLGGSATPGTDFEIYSSFLNVTSLTSNGSVEYSGGPCLFYVVPLNDAIFESSESVTATLGVPYVPGSGGPIPPVTFTYGTTTVTATIIDDDNWSFVAEQLDDEGTPIPAISSTEIMIQEPGDAEEEVTPVLFRVSRSNVGDSPVGDLSYPVSVTFRATGSATATGNNHDFSLWSWNGSLSSFLTPIVSTLGALFTIEFPAGIESLSLAIIPSFDGIVELLHETLDISVLSAVSANEVGGVYSVDNSEINYTIADADVLVLEETSFSNELPLTPDVYNPDWYRGVDWKRNVPTYTLPVAYSSTSFFGIFANVTGGIDTSLSYEIKVKIKFKVNPQAENSVESESMWFAFNGRNTFLMLTETFSQLIGFQTACYDPTFSLTWYFRVNGGETRDLDVGDYPQTTTLYVTFNTPTSGTELYHTVVHHSCVAASATDLIPIDPSDTQEEIIAKTENNEERIYLSICAKFESLSVEKVNWSDGCITLGDPLTYYGREVLDPSNYNPIKGILSYTYSYLYDTVTTDQSPSRAREFAREGVATDCLETEGLLKYGDGTCGAWQKFFINVVECQGIGHAFSMKVTVDNQSVPHNTGEDIGFKIKSNIRGQGDIIPRENTWNSHHFVMYRNQFFDPSYGINYGIDETEGYEQLKQWLINNIDGVGRSQHSPYDGYGLCFFIVFESCSLTSDLLDISFG